MDRGAAQRPVPAWLRECWPEVRAGAFGCAQRATRIVSRARPSSPFDPEDFLHHAVVRLLERTDRFASTPVDLATCCRILCSFMLGHAVNEWRKAERRRRLLKGL
jgi:hypothetical protein